MSEFLKIPFLYVFTYCLNIFRITPKAGKNRRSTRQNNNLTFMFFERQISYFCSKGYNAHKIGETFSFRPFQNFLHNFLTVFVQMNVCRDQKQNNLLLRTNTVGENQNIFSIFFSFLNILTLRFVAFHSNNFNV